MQSFTENTTFFMIKRMLVLLFVCLSELLHSNAQSYKWASKSSSMADDFASDVTIDQRRNYYVVGEFEGTINFDSAGFTRTLSSAGLSDIYVARFNCSRNLLWSNRIGGGNNEAGAYNYVSVDYDGIGNVYVTGTFSGTATFTTKSGLNRTVVSAGGDDAFVVKYDTSGTLVWVVTIGGIDQDEGGNIVVDHAGNVIVCGKFAGFATWRATSGSTASLTSGGSGDAFVAKYTAAGQLMWATKGSSLSEDIAITVSVDRQNNIYTSGNFTCCAPGSINFGGQVLSNTGGWGAFLAKIDPNGVCQWINGLGGAAQEGGSSCVADDSGNIFFTGHFDGTTSMSSSPSGPSVSVNHIGGYDVFFAKYNTSGVLDWVRSIGGSGNDFNADVELNSRGNVVISGTFSGSCNFLGETLVSSGLGDMYVAEYTKTGTLLQCIKGGGSGADIGLRIKSDLLGGLYLAGSFTGSAGFGSTVLSGLGGYESVVAKISSGNLFNLTATPNTQACIGDSIVLSSQTTLPVNATFRWLRNNIVIPNETNSTITVKVGGSYQLVVLGSCSEQDTSQPVAITFTSLVLTPMADQVMCFGDSVQLAATGGTSYSWSPVIGLSSSTIPNPIAKPVSTQEYIVTVTNSVCSAKDTVRITVNNNCCFSCSTVDPLNTGLVGCYPFNGNTNDETANGNHGIGYSSALLTTDRRNQPASAYSFDGSSTAKIEIPASPVLNTATMGSFTYACWFNPSAPTIPGVNTRVFCIQDASGRNYDLSYNYQLNKLIFINFNVSSINIQISSNTTFAIGTWYHIALVIDGSERPSLYVNGQLDVSSTARVIRPINPKYTIGNHTVINWNFAGKIDDVRVYNRALSPAELNLLWLQYQRPEPVIQPIADKTICLGDSIQLVATGGTSYAWFPTTGLSDSTVSNPFAKPLDTTTYRVSVSLNGCVKNDTVTVNVLKLIANAGLDTSICSGDSVRFNATGGTSYAWKQNATLSDTAISNPYAKPADSTKYYVHVSNGVCSILDSVSVFVMKVNANAGTDQTICRGDSVQLQAIGNNGFTYSWTPAGTLSNPVIRNPYAKPGTTTTYNLVMNDGRCSGQDSVTITVADLNALNAGLDTSICLGDSVQLNATGASVYTWNTAVGLSDSSIANPIAFPLTSIDYILLGTLGTCSDTDTIRVTVNPLPSVNLGRDTTICINANYRFNPRVSNGDAYSWTPAALFNNPSALNPTINITNAQSVALTVTNSATGCSNEDQVFVNAQKPSARFLLEDSISNAPPLVMNPVNTSFPLPLSYYWEVFDQVPATYTDLEPTHTFTGIGSYRVKLTVSDTLGCTDTLSRFVSITGTSTVFIPNVFTPNGDQLNDVFEIRFTKTGIREMRGSIWNRWGEVVFEFGSPDYTWWDGTVKGTPAPDGVYFYIVDVVDLKGVKKQYHGTITLLR